MKLLKNKKVIKILSTILIVFTLFNFIMPNYVQADFGGALFAPLGDLLCGIADVVLEILQNIFVTSHTNILNTLDTGLVAIPTYTIRYSPGIIFSGTVPALDINFIDYDPDEDDTDDLKYYIQIGNKIELEVDDENLESHLQDNYRNARCRNCK